MHRKVVSFHYIKRFIDYFRQKMKVIYVKPKDEDPWKDLPAIKLVMKGGIWTRERLVKKANGNWERVGRLVKKHYTE